MTRHESTRPGPFPATPPPAATPDAPPPPVPLPVSECWEFPGWPGQCPEARALVRTALRGRPALVDDAELVVAELFGNACRHTRSGEPGGSLAVSVSALATGLAVVSVTDQGPTRADWEAGRRRHPQLTPASPGACGGRGLRLVAALADGWGYTPAEELGLTVWAAFNVATLSLDGVADGATL